MKKIILSLISVCICNLYAQAPELPKPPAPLKVTKPAQLPVERKVQPAVEGLTPHEVLQTVQAPQQVSKIEPRSPFEKEVLNRLTSIEQRLTDLENKSMVTRTQPRPTMQPGAQTQEAPVQRTTERIGERLQRLKEISQQEPQLQIFQNRPVLKRLLEEVGTQE